VSKHSIRQAPKTSAVYSSEQTFISKYIIVLRPTENHGAGIAHAYRNQSVAARLTHVSTATDGREDFGLSCSYVGRTCN
jgi:hypothetical protein